MQAATINPQIARISPARPGRNQRSPSPAPPQPNPQPLRRRVAGMVYAGGGFSAGNRGFPAGQNLRAARRNMDIVIRTTFPECNQGNDGGPVTEGNEADQGGSSSSPLDKSVRALLSLSVCGWSVDSFGNGRLDGTML